MKMNNFLIQFFVFEKLKVRPGFWKLMFKF